MLPLHDLAVGIVDGMAISELTLADEGPATDATVTFRPGALAVL
jgi:hypothetical protein